MEGCFCMWLVLMSGGDDHVYRGHLRVERTSHQSEILHSLIFINSEHLFKNSLTSRFLFCCMPHVFRSGKSSSL